MDQPSGRRRRRLGRIAAALVGGALLLAAGLPLIVRGPVARWALGQVTAPLCGTFHIGGGHLGWAAIFQIARGRPVPLILTDVRITGADGRDIFVAARLEARLELHASRVVLSDVLMADGMWRLALPDTGIGTFDAFRTVPLAGRAACLDPHAARPAAKKTSGGGAGAIMIQSIEFANVDVDLDFPTWGLTLAHASAAGELALGGDGPPITFEARDVVATGGQLRVGQPGAAWTARVPFDGAALTRVGVSRQAPTDLWLDVAGATTGAARLAGRAGFLNIFPSGPHTRPTKPPGLSVDARWTHVGAALRALDAGWRPRGSVVEHLDGDLALGVSGPFSALEGTLLLTSGGTRVSARVAHGAAELTLALAGVETAWMLDPAVRPLLGGLLHGHFRATARLAPTLAGLDAEIADADLRLDRRRAPSGPRRFALRIGQSGRPGSETDTLYAAIRGVRLADATLRLDGLRVDWTGLTSRLDAEVAFPGAAGPSRSRVEAHGALNVAALEDWVPGGAVTGPLRLTVAARGTLERVDLGLLFPPPRTVAVLGQRFGLPRRLDVIFGTGAGLDVPRFRLQRVGGGTIEVGGRVGADGNVAAALTVRDYPAGEIPGLSGLGLPGTLSGRLGAALKMTGAFERPALDGTVSVERLTYDRKLVGDLATTVRLGPDGGEATATVDPGVEIHARVRRRPALAVDASLALRERAVGPWLPPPLTGIPAALSGEAHVALRAGAAPTGEATLQVTAPGFSGVTVDGRLAGADTRAHVAGQIDIASWPQLWSKFLARARGAFAVDLTATPGLPRPHLAGRLRVARALTVESARWPAPVAVAAGGRLALDGDALTVDGLAISTAGLRGDVAGRATLDADDPARTRLALRLKADLDAAVFPVKLPPGASARGHLLVDARIGGTLGAAPGPRVDGLARVDDLYVQLSPTTPVARARGVIQAQGDTLRTDDLEVALAGVGTVAIGRPDAPARAELASLSPFQLGTVDVPLRGVHLTIGGPGAQLFIPSLDVDLHLTGDGRRDLVITGQAAMSGGSYDRSRGGSSAPATAPKPSKPRVSGPWYRALPPHLTLDLTLRDSNKGLRVAVPVLPDVSIDFRCRLVATNRGATWSGDLHGHSVYSRAAVTLADWFYDGDLKKCQLTK